MKPKRRIRRGYSAVALDRPQKDSSLGGAMRAAGVYLASLIVVGGDARAKIENHADTMCAYRHIPTIRCGDVLDVIPYDCVPVAVELLEDAVPLPEFDHPERAYYIFGTENGTLPERITSRCGAKVYVPSPSGLCMNLAAAVNVILADRYAKREFSRLKKQLE
ncbi:MAG: TrmH family RNA methyltransferase [Gammaproteobacteria bacterium]|nr:TrmH family RNA methyltransferase [Gammaproteobacteria bacterium]